MRHRQITALIALLAALVVSGCGSARHPGAVSELDSDAYDALLMAQGVIEQAREEHEAGELPPQALFPLERLRTSYNAALDLWVLYRNGPDDGLEQRLSDSIESMLTAVRGFRSAR